MELSIFMICPFICQRRAESPLSSVGWRSLLDIILIDTASVGHGPNPDVAGRLLNGPPRFDLRKKRNACRYRLFFASLTQTRQPLPDGRVRAKPTPDRGPLSRLHGAHRHSAPPRAITSSIPAGGSTCRRTTKRGKPRFSN